MGTEKSEVKWSPGPWWVVVDENEVMSSNGGNIADCWSAFAGIDDDEATANAHLIAAAPDLYEALAEAADPLSGYLCGPALDRARAALAKARGE
jgi:hypothetical protein